MNILNVYTSPPSREDWAEIDLPDSMLALSDLDSIIIFADPADSTGPKRLNVSHRTVHINESVADYAARQPSTDYLPEVTLKKDTVRYHSVAGTDWITKRCVYGMTPEVDGTDEQLDSVLLTHLIDDPIDVGVGRVFSLGGLLYCSNNSKHGVQLPEARRALRSGYERIGYWDWRELGEVTQYRFDRSRVINITESYFDYWFPDPLPNCNWLFIFGGRLQVELTPYPISDQVIRFPLSEDLRVRIFVWLWEDLNETYGLLDLYDRTSPINRSDVLTDVMLLNMLEDPLSSYIQTDHRIQHIDVEPILNRNNDTVINCCGSALPLISDKFKHPEYRRLTSSRPLYRLFVTNHLLHQHERWIEDTKSEWLGLTRTVPDGVQPIRVSQLRIYKTRLE